MTQQPSKSNEIEKLRPRVEWIPRSEHEYLQRQKLLPFFRGWVNQIWEAQKPHIEAILAAKDAERIKAVEEERERIFKEMRAFTFEACPYEGTMMRMFINNYPTLTPQEVNSEQN